VLKAPVKHIHTLLAPSSLCFLLLALLCTYPREVADTYGID